jgi:hypothetical protein
MKNNQNDRYQEGYSFDQSNHKSYDEYNILEPSPDGYIQFLGDDEDEISDYSLMDIARDTDFEE